MPPCAASRSSVQPCCAQSATGMDVLSFNSPFHIALSTRASQEVKLPSIAGTVIANSNLNLLGMGATIISLQAGCRL